MLLDAVSRGDTAAALWFADSLLKWWNSRRYSFGETNPYDFQKPAVTAAGLWDSWADVRLSWCDEDDHEPVMADVVAQILYRYWSDVRVVGVLLLLRWIPPDAPQDSLAFNIAVSLVKGRSIKAGGALDSVPMDFRTSSLSSFACSWQTVDTAACSTNW